MRQNTEGNKRKDVIVAAEIPNFPKLVMQNNPFKVFP